MNTSFATLLPTEYLKQDSP